MLCDAVCSHTWHRPIQFGVSSLNRSIALVTSNNSPIVPGAGAFAGFEIPEGCRFRRVSPLPAQLGLSIGVFLRHSFDQDVFFCATAQRGDQRSGPARQLRLVFPSSSVSFMTRASCAALCVSVCLSALHFTHQRARQQEGGRPRLRRRRGTATTRPPGQRPPFFLGISPQE